MAAHDELVRRAQAGERDSLVRLVEREQARIRDSQRIVIDGDAGTVRLLD